MDRVPEDFDIATSAPPTAVRTLFPNTVPVGAKFGVVLVLGEPGGEQVEVATFRSESGYADHRHPQVVRYGDARGDAERRDFTMNGLFLDPETGRIVDYVEGQADIRNRTIRAIGTPSDRLNEDALRILRALRFSSSLDFAVESGTWEAVRSLAPTVDRISSERVRDELLKGFTRPHPDRFLDLLDSSGLLRLLLPEVESLKGCEQPPEFHPEGDVFVHTRLALSHLPPNPTPALAIATLLHDIGKPPTRTFKDRIRFNDHHRVGAELADAVCRRLVLPNDLREDIVSMVRRHMDFMNVRRMRTGTLRRFLAFPLIDSEVELHRADCLASHGSTENCEFTLARLAEIRAASGNTALPPRLVTGEDLLALGLKPGPVYREILTAVHDAQMDGSAPDRDAALALARRLARDSSQDDSETT
jgi:poly(A) polymerase